MKSLIRQFYASEPNLLSGPVQIPVAIQTGKKVLGSNPHRATHETAMIQIRIGAALSHLMQ